MRKKKTLPLKILHQSTSLIKYKNIIRSWNKKNDNFDHKAKGIEKQKNKIAAYHIQIQAPREESIGTDTTHPLKTKIGVRIVFNLIPNHSEKRKNLTQNNLGHPISGRSICQFVVPFFLWIHFFFFSHPIPETLFGIN